MTDDAYNPWHHKPWWCQPWSIVLTGVSLPVGTWFLFHWIWLTLLVAFPLMLWMVFFLAVWPTLMRQAMIAETEAVSGKPEG